MADIRRALEERRRDFAPAPGGFERLVRRRQRRVRYRRIEAGALALVVVAAGGVGVARVLARLGEQPHPAGPTIDASNVRDLRPGWTATVAGPRIPVQPAVSGGLVYVSSDRSVEAFRTTCGAAGTSCSPAWIGVTGQTAEGQAPSAPVVADGMVFVASDRLYAFPARCGTGGHTCSPLWTSREHRWPFANVAVGNGLVYVGAERLYAFSTRCPVSHCGALWETEPEGFQPPSAGAGMVFASSGVLLAYRAGCATPCSPAWRGQVPTLSPPALSEPGQGDLVYVTSGDTLYAFPVNCRPAHGGTCPPAWTGTPQPGVDLGAPVVGGGLVYVGGDRLYAFAEECARGGGTCPLTWMGPVQSGPEGTQSWAGSAPAIANGVVFAATDRVYAFRAHCAGGGSVCAPLWVGPATPSGYGLSSPTIAGGAVYAVSAQGVLYTYALSSGA
jgi:outer membrane protein assembly factor BamB